MVICNSYIYSNILKYCILLPSIGALLLYYVQIYFIVYMTFCILTSLMLPCNYTDVNDDDDDDDNNNKCSHSGKL